MVTVVIANALPSEPVQDNWNVWSLFNADVVSEPVIDFEPFQPPVAVQLETFIADQVNVVVPPGATPRGEALS